MQGTHLAFEPHLSIQKMQENLSLLLKSVLIQYAHEAFQKPLETATHIFKTQYRAHPFF